MCCDASFMTNIVTTPQPYHAALPNSHIIMVNHLGTVTLSPDIVLHNVLFVLEFKCNLLSISILAQDSNYIITLSANGCLFQDQNQVKTLPAGTEQGGLYYFSISSSF